MIEIDALKAQDIFGEILDRVAGGEQIVITRFGRQVARLVSEGEVADRLVAEAAANRIQSRAQDLKISFDWQEVKADRDTNRR